MAEEPGAEELDVVVITTVEAEGAGAVDVGRGVVDVSCAGADIALDIAVGIGLPVVCAEDIALGPKADIDPVDIKGAGISLADAAIEEPEAGDE